MPQDFFRTDTRGRGLRRRMPHLDTLIRVGTAMKTQTPLLIGALVVGLAGCRGPQPQAARPEPGPAPRPETASPQLDEAAARTGASGIFALNDSADRLRVVRQLPGTDLEQVVAAMNRQYPLPGINLKGRKGATVAVEVRDSERLTQRMGSSGAQGYLAAVTYSLTSVPGVEAVEFRFAEGDHAAPGVYRRKDFQDYAAAP